MSDSIAISSTGSVVFASGNAKASCGNFRAGGQFKRLIIDGSGTLKDGDMIRIGYEDDTKIMLVVESAKGA